MKGRVDVGVLFPLTGPKATSGGATVDAFPVAFQIARDRGVADGLTLSFHYGDASDEEKGAEECARLIDEGCRVIMGALISSHSLAFSEVAHRRGVFYWEVVAAAAEVTARGYPYLFRQSSGAHQYGKHLAAFLEDHLLPGFGAKADASTIAILTEATSFGRSVGDSVAAEASRLGLSIGARAEHHPQQEDVSDQVEQIASSAPDFVFSASLGPVVPRIWNELGRQQVPLAALVGTGSWGLPRYMSDQFEGAIDGVYCLDSPHLATLSPDNLLPGARETFDRWMELSPIKHSKASIVDPDLAVMAVTTLVEEVLPRTDSLDAEELTRAAREIDVPRGGTVVGYGTKFAPNGDNERSFRTVVQWQDGGDLRTVYPDFLAIAEPRVERLK